MHLPQEMTLKMRYLDLTANPKELQLHEWWCRLHGSAQRTLAHRRAC